jgi:predicted MFS family arabinose efflux permease
MIMMFAVAQATAVEVWMVFPFMLLLGVGGLVNMTVQRAWVVDVSGRRLGMRALAMDSAALAFASMAGPVICGAIIASVGTGAAFGGLAVALGLSIAITVRIPASTPRAVPAEAGRPSPLAQVRQGRSLLRRSPGLVGMLGVTIIFNFCFFSLTPLVPAMAERFRVDATLAGVLAGAAGAGSVVAGLVLVSRRPAEPGQLYSFGAGLGLAFLAAFGSAPVFGLGLVALAAAGCASAGFTAMQSSLAIDAAPDEERGLALGLLSMAIGALPLGMLAMGMVARLAGPRMAVQSFGLGGLATLALWLRWRPELLRRSDEYGPPVEVDARARVAGL